MKPAEELMSQLKWPKNNPERTIAVRAVVNLIDDQLALKNFVRNNAVELFERYSHQIPEELASYDVSVVLSSLALIQKMLDDAESLPFLITKLRRLSNEYASKLVGWFGAEAQEALPFLIENVAENAYGSRASDIAIIRIGATARPLVLAEFRNQYNKQEDYEAFARIGDTAIKLDCYEEAEFIQVIQLAAQSRDPMFQAAASELVEDIPPSARQKFLSMLSEMETPSAAGQERGEGSHPETQQDHNLNSG